MSKSNTKRKQSTETEVQIMAPEIPTAPTNERKNEVELTQEQWEKICADRGFKTKSSMIRYLWAEGYTRSAIAKHLGIIYQHVRNVLIQEPKRASTLATSVPVVQKEQTSE